MDVKTFISNYSTTGNILEIKEGVDYIPFAHKVTVVDSILAQCIKESNNIKYIDSIMLNRMKTQVFIELCSNLELSICDENGLDGYDQLCKHNLLNVIIETCGEEYKTLDALLNSRLEDFKRDEMCFANFVNKKIDALEEWLETSMMAVSAALKDLNLNLGE